MTMRSRPSKAFYSPIGPLPRNTSLPERAGHHVLDHVLDHELRVGLPGGDWD